MMLRHSISLLATTLAMFPLIARSAQATEQPRVTGPVMHENVTVYFVHGASAPGPVPQTLQEALAKGTVVVHETGNVQELKIENKGSEPVFVQFGDIVKGGQQDRVLTVSMVLEPKSGQIPIGAYCVEQGRWAARGKEDVKKFALADAIIPSREAKIAMAKPSVRLGGPPQEAQAVASATTSRPGEAAGVNSERRQQRTVGGDGGESGQGAVWKSVSEVQRRLSEKLGASVTAEQSRSSLQLSLENEKLKTAKSAYITALEPAGLKAEDIVGVVVAVDGKLSSADVYPSNGLFRKMWPKLAHAAATEAISGKAKASDAPAIAVAVTQADVLAFLAKAEQGAPTERKLGSHAKLETRDSESVLRVEARKTDGGFVHRNYLAK